MRGSGTWAARSQPDVRSPRAGESASSFERWGHFVCRARWWVVALSLLSTLLCASFLPGITIDNSTEAFLLPGDPAVVAYNAFRDEFTRDDRLLIAIGGTEVFELGFLERLRALHQAVERVKWVRSG